MDEMFQLLPAARERPKVGVFEDQPGYMSSGDWSQNDDRHQVHQNKTEHQRGYQQKTLSSETRRQSNTRGHR
jgi:hypothetical protein